MGVMRGRRAGLGLFCALGLGIAGCYVGSVEKPTQESSSDSASSRAQQPEALLEPFTPPPLAEIDAQAQWVDQPLLDGLATLRERQADDTPLATVDEALQLRNDSPEANKKILSALGRPAAVGDEVTVSGVRLRVESIDRLRITGLSLQLPPGAARPGHPGPVRPGGLT